MQFKLKTTATTPLDLPMAPVILWGGTFLFALFTMLPLPYKHIKNAPADIAHSLRKSQRVKYWLLLLAALSFIAGLLWAVNIIAPA